MLAYLHKSSYVFLKLLLELQSEHMKKPNFLKVQFSRKKVFCEKFCS